MGHDGSTSFRPSRERPKTSTSCCKVADQFLNEKRRFLPRQITGVFMKNCMLHYAAYRNIYPLWALAEYRNEVKLAS
ncbi:hypothetical protein CsSME_00029810 [Camellia sinensis var. sinensis]